MELLTKGINILNWYNENKRDLPWRQTSDPYKIWISEIMLQQTRVDTVIEYYLRFIAKFPEVKSLAEADQDEVLTQWKGLGYYSRAKNLHKAANVVMHRYGGIFPETLEEVLSLPGIGAYTAGAILSIAFNQNYPAVDGNVLRVIARLEAFEEDILQEKTKKLVTAVVERMIPENHARDFTQAMMELGALICVPAKPQCNACPVADFCLAYRNGLQEVLPIRKKKEKSSPQLNYWVAVIEDQENILMEYRSEESLLGQMWGLPMVDKAAGPSMVKEFELKYNVHLDEIENVGTVTHIFTHRVWKMDVIKCQFKEIGNFQHGLQWIEKKKIEEYAVPTAFQKVLAF